jgi:O-antigen ligase/tetratricopeptide (TPR) repeat protein
MTKEKEIGKKASALPFLVGCAGCVFVLLATLVIFRTPLNPGLPIAMGGALAVLAALLRLICGSGPYYRCESEIAVLLMLWMAICSFFSVDEYLSQRSLGSFVGAVAFLQVMQTTLRSRKQWRSACYTLIGLCTLVSVLAWIPAVQAARKTGVLASLMGTFVNPDTFSILPLLALCLTLGLIEKARPAATVLLLSICGVLLATIFATGCRASMLGFFVGCALFLTSILYFRRDKADKTKLLVGFPIVLTLLALPLLGYRYSFSHKWTRMFETNATEVEEIRFELLKYGWKAIFQNPLFGSGPGTFGLSYQSVRPPGQNFLYINIAHNDFLEMGTELGLPGLVLWVALTCACLSIPFKLIKNGRRPTEAAGIVASVTALGVYSLFNFIVVQRPVLWAEFWLFGLALSFPSSRTHGKESNIARYGGSMLLLSLGCWATLSGYRSAKADLLYTEAKLYSQRLEIEEAKKLYEAGRTLEPPRVESTLELVALLEKLRLFNDEKNLETQLALLEETRAASPRSIPLLLKITEVQLELVTPEEANKTLSIAHQTAPYSRDVFETQLEVLLMTGKLEEAANLLAGRTYLQREENATKFAAVLFGLAQINPKAAWKISDDWLDAHPDEPGLYIIRSAINLARAEQAWDVERGFINSIKKAQPNDLCLEMDIARNLSEEGGPEDEFNYLNEIRTSNVDNADPCFSKLLERWCTLGLSLKRDSEVREALASFITIAPTRSWARVLLARAMVDDGQTAAAAKLLRDGLDKKPNDSRLVLGLAEVFEKQGSRDLALNYYRQALKLDPNNGISQAKIDQLLP